MSVLPRPDPRPRPADWSAVTSRLGTELPGDYRAFCDRWGAVRIWDDLNIEAPADADEFGLVGFVRWKLAIDSDLREDGQWQGAVWPEPEGLLPWGWFDDGTVLLWRTGGQPASWPVVLRRDDEEVDDCGELTDTGLSGLEFLADRLARLADPIQRKVEVLSQTKWDPLGEADEVDMGAEREGGRWHVSLCLGPVLGEPGTTALEGFLLELDAQHPRLRELIVEVRPRRSREELIVNSRWLGKRRCEEIR